MIATIHIALVGIIQKESRIIDFQNTGEKSIATVKLISRYVEYKINKDTKKIIGDNGNRVEKENILVFEKYNNVKVQKASRKCPNCGVNMDISNSGKCEYCGSIYNLDDYDYILTSIE